MPLLFHDYETRSTLNLKKVGSWRYTTHPTTDVWCCAWAVDDEPVQLWRPGDPVPEPFVEAARNPDWLIVAHNMAFERHVALHITGPRYDFPLIPIERQRCTFTSALSHALPGSLAGVALALDLPQQKDMAGRENMLKMAAPRKPRRGEDPAAGPYWHDDPDALQLLFAYNLQDGEVCREVWRRLGFVPDFEQLICNLDAEINDFGFPVDRELVDRMFDVVNAVRADLDSEILQLTSGEIERVTMRDRIQAWLAERGCPVTNMQEGTITRALRRKGLSAEAQRVLELYQAGSHAAAAKPGAMRDWLDPDDRVRGSLKIYGTKTGRWTGRGPQPQNLKRPLTKDIAGAIAAIKSRDLDLIRRTFPQPLAVIGDLGRAMICARPGFRLIAADFSGIESRVTAWLAGEQRKVDLWARYDLTGLAEDDPYIVMGYALGTGVNDPATARALGKIADLAFGFGGGQGAYANFAPEGDTATPHDIRRMQLAWQRAHPRIKEFWKALNDAAIAATEHPGAGFLAGDKIAFIREDDFLFAELPSGRRLSYPFPRVEIQSGKISFIDEDTGEPVTKEKVGPVLIHKELNINKRWGDCGKGHKLGTWGGTLCENVVSGTARDLLTAAMLRIDAAGYRIVVTNHDEIVAEVPDGFGSTDKFDALMRVLPDWVR